jgi:hypothetical protein
MFEKRKVPIFVTVPIISQCRPEEWIAKHIHFRSTILLLLLLLLTTVTQAAARMKLTMNLDGWNKDATAAATAAGVSRIWELPDLHAASSVMDFNQMRPFLERLHDGKPVTVLALGDSITANYGGCFQRDGDHLKEHVQVSIKS